MFNFPEGSKVKFVRIFIMCLDEAESYYRKLEDFSYRGTSMYN